MKGEAIASLLQNLWPYGIALSRWLSFTLMLPGFGEVFLTPRIRFLLAFSFSACMTPLLLEQKILADTLEISFFFQEIVIGIFLGLLVRLIVETACSVGGIISHEISLSNIVSEFFQTANQDLLQTFFKIYFVTLIFVSDLHLLFLKGLYKSYLIFPAGSSLLGSLFLEDMASTVVSWVEHGFKIAVQMSAPLLIAGLCYYVLLGLINRLVPQIPVFFVGRPLEIGLGFLILILSLMAMTMTFHNEIFQMASGFLE